MFWLWTHSAKQFMKYDICDGGSSGMKRINHHRVDIAYRGDGMNDDDGLVINHYVRGHAMMGLYKDLWCLVTTSNVLWKEFYNGLLCWSYWFLTQLNMKGCTIIGMFFVSTQHSWRIMRGLSYGKSISLISPCKTDVQQKSGVMMDGSSWLTHVMSLESFVNPIW